MASQMASQLVSSERFVLSCMAANGANPSRPQLWLGTTSGHSREREFSGQRRLLWKKRLQDSEREAQRQKEEAARQPARQERTEMLGSEHVLAPHLREHQRQVHAALAEAETRKMAESSPKVDQGAWKARAESLVAGFNLDNAAMRKLFIM